MFQTLLPATHRFVDPAAHAVAGVDQNVLLGFVDTRNVFVGDEDIGEAPEVDAFGSNQRWGRIIAKKAASRSHPP